MEPCVTTRRPAVKSSPNARAGLRTSRRSAALSAKRIARGSPELSPTMKRCPVAVSTSSVPWRTTRFRNERRNTRMSLTVHVGEHAFLRRVAEPVGGLPEGRNLGDELALLRHQRMVVENLSSILRDAVRQHGESRHLVCTPTQSVEEQDRALQEWTLSWSLPHSS